MVVVLPEPFGPRKPKIWPRGTSKSIASTAVNVPKRLVSPRTEIAAPGSGSVPARWALTPDKGASYSVSRRRVASTAAPKMTAANPAIAHSGSASAAKSLPLTNAPRSTVSA